MRYTKLNPDTVIHSPWLSTREAAAYLGMGVDKFRELAKRTALPAGNLCSARKPRYHVKVLDEWLQSDRTLAVLAEIDTDRAS